MTQKIVKNQIVIIQGWEESGWSVRQDGCSVHLTVQDKEDFCNEFMAAQRKRLGESTPEEYDRPMINGTIKGYITEEKMEELVKSKNGIRTYDRNPKWISRTPFE